MVGIRLPYSYGAHLVFLSMYSFRVNAAMSTQSMEDSLHSTVCKGCSIDAKPSKSRGSSSVVAHVRCCYSVAERRQPVAAGTSPQKTEHSHLSRETAKASRLRSQGVCCRRFTAMGSTGTLTCGLAPAATCFRHFVPGESLSGTNCVLSTIPIDRNCTCS